MFTENPTSSSNPLTNSSPTPDVDYSCEPGEFKNSGEKICAFSTVMTIQLSDQIFITINVNPAIMFDDDEKEKCILPSCLHILIRNTDHNF